MSKKVFLILFILGLGFCFLANQSQALTVGPVKLEFSADPEDVIEGQCLLFNEGEEAGTFYPSFELFTYKKGEMKYLGEKTGLASWIETVPKVFLEPKETKKIPFSIKVPEDAEPGGHSAIIWWSTAPPATEAGGMTIVTRTGILVLLRVSGEVIESGKIVSFETENQKRFFSHLPINFILQFENSGNVQLKPQGEIEITNIFGRTIAILAVNEVGSHTFPEDIRAYTVSWNPKISNKGITGEGFFDEIKREKAGWAPGIYRAELSLNYGQELKQDEKSFRFFVIPWRILILAVLILGLIFLGATKGIQKYNQWVITKAKERLKNE